MVYSTCIEPSLIYLCCLFLIQGTPKNNPFTCASQFVLRIRDRLASCFYEPSIYNKNRFWKDKNNLILDKKILLFWASASNSTLASCCSLSDRRDSSLEIPIWSSFAAQDKNVKKLTQPNLLGLHQMNNENRNDSLRNLQCSGDIKRKDWSTS